MREYIRENITLFLHQIFQRTEKEDHLYSSNFVRLITCITNKRLRYTDKGNR